MTLAPIGGSLPHARAAESTTADATSSSGAVRIKFVMAPGSIAANSNQTEEMAIRENIKID